MKNSSANFFPLGATPRNGGVNFALYSKYAEGVDLLLFDRASDSRPSRVIPVKNRIRLVWHTFIDGIGPGQCYAYRVKGPYRPEEGLRFNENRLLMDPYTRAFTGKFDPAYCHLGYDPLSPEEDLSFNRSDNAAGAPKCLVVDDNYEWEGDKPPQLDMHDTIIYELHVKGFTAHSSSGVKHPGTFIGLTEKIPYLLDLGITAVELLPVHLCQDGDFLMDEGLKNYWGYDTLGYFAPDVRFGTGSYPGCEVAEFKDMVKAFHRAGIEVLLDVVYNHTCEGNERGPTYSFRGIDNPTYYRLTPDKRFYQDFTGCGNTLNVDDPQVIKLITDSLRYWVEVMHVDGFRFDLASALGRDEGRFEQVSSFFMAIHQDPVLSHIKLIAEPWDISADSYQAGNFPNDWSEWNGRYRDCVRKFVKSDPGMLPEIASRLAGSADLYGSNGRTPYHSINFVTCHDGFTLNDLVSYDRKHNEANLENNRDGSNDNYSWNCGAEGETADPAILELRRRRAKNFIALLMLSQGVPMLLGGDEFLRTQRGNNNAYCQDNKMSWFDWTLTVTNADMLDFVRRLIAFRKSHPHFARPRFFTGANIDRDALKDINWFDEHLKSPDWNNTDKRSLAFLIEGIELEDIDGGAEEDVLVLLNFQWEPLKFEIPRCLPGSEFHLMLDTGFPPGREFMDESPASPIPCDQGYTLGPRSLAVLTRKTQ
ncbi:MAG: glycogen debranching protein GlgX [bacterium]